VESFLVDGTGDHGGNLSRSGVGNGPLDVGESGPAAVSLDFREFIVPRQDAGGYDVYPPLLRLFRPADGDDFFRAADDGRRPAEDRLVAVQDRNAGGQYFFVPQGFKTDLGTHSRGVSDGDADYGLCHDDLSSGTE
jgi:hypothetical protein